MDWTAMGVLVGTAGVSVTALGLVIKMRRNELRHVYQAIEKLREDVTGEIADLRRELFQHLRDHGKG